MKQPGLFIVMISAVVVVAACGTPAPAIPSTGPRVVLTPGEPGETPVPAMPSRPVDFSQAQTAALQALTAATGVRAEQIQVLTSEPEQWPDSCLGTTQAEGACVPPAVNGFSIVLAADGRLYEYRTNEDGSVIVLASEQSPYVRLAVRTADNRVVLADSPLLIDPTADLVSWGLLAQAGSIGSTVYALDPAAPTRAISIELGVIHLLDFVQNPTFGLAVWPDTTGSSSLAWGAALAGDAGHTALLTSATDGSARVTLLDEPGSGPTPYQLVARRWSVDGQALYFSREPIGLGGYIPFAGASSLYRITLVDRTVTELLAFSPESGRAACVDDLSLDDRLVSHHCDGAQISILDRGNGRTLKVTPPAEASGYHLAGSARFDPSSSRVAYALAVGDPNNEQGWVAVSEGLVGQSQLVLASNRGEFLTVAGWLDDDTLVVQSISAQCTPTCVSSVWTVALDGGRLTKVADGTFLTTVGR